VATRGSFRTVDVARAAGTHENTVRLYVEWGFLAEPERAANGYRRWTAGHIDQMLFARLALRGLWPGRPIRESALALVRRAATGDLAGAAVDARIHAALVEAEIARAESAAAFLERWAAGTVDTDGGDERIGPREAAEAVGATPGQIRNWERNRLVAAIKDPVSGHRTYGPDQIGRLRVVRSLLLAGYSVMALLRMTTELDRGRSTGLKDVLNTPRPDEEALTAFDRWLDSLAEQRERAALLVETLEARMGAGR